MTLPIRQFEFMDVPALKRNWGWLLTLGVLLSVLGLIAIGSAGYTTLVTIIFLGIILAAGGIASIIFSFSASKWTGFFVSLLLGIFYLVTAGLLLFRPIESAAALTLLIGSLFVVSGLFKIFAPMFHKFTHWGWVLFSGLVSLLLGLMVLGGWPATSLWVIGLFVGIDLFFYGLSAIFFALAVKNLRA